MLVLSLGGTIAMTTRAGTTGATPSLSGTDLVEAVPELKHVAEVVVQDFRQMPGASLGFGDIVSLARRITEAVEAGVAGVVVTQGTDTLEETAYLTSLYYQGDAPVVFTGAMRNAALPGADGPANLLAAVQVAAEPQARHEGVLVVLADEIHAARYVRKLHTSAPAAFGSPLTGPIGTVREGRVHLRVPAPAVGSVAWPKTTEEPVVEIVVAALGSSGTLLDRLGETAHGVVVAAFGAGHVPASWCDRLEGLARAMPVVLTSRIGTGSVLSKTYAFEGSESDLLKRGLISAGSLDPYKARLLLSAHLAAQARTDEIREAFHAQSL